MGFGCFERGLVEAGFRMGLWRLLDWVRVILGSVFVGWFWIGGSVQGRYWVGLG